MSKILDKTPRTLSQPLLLVTGEHDLPIILARIPNNTLSGGTSLDLFRRSG